MPQEADLLPGTLDYRMSLFNCGRAGKARNLVAIGFRFITSVIGCGRLSRSRRWPRIPTMQRHCPETKKRSRCWRSKPRIGCSTCLALSPP